MKSHFAPWLAGFVLTAISSSVAFAEERVALVVGNGAYQHTTTLTNPPGDAAAIAASLKRLGFTVIEGRDLTRRAFEEALREFAAELKNADAALLFYAGHGLQIDDENWLVPVDSRIETEMDLELTAIPLTAVLRAMERGPRVRLVLLDACRDNPMVTHLAQGLGNRSSALARGLAPVAADIGTIVAYSTQPGAVAADGPGDHSVFAGALLAEIETQGLDVRRMLTRVRARVIEATGNKQVPWDQSALTGNFFFKPGKFVESAAAGPAVAPLQPIEAVDDPACRRAQASIDTQYIGGLNTKWLLRDAEICLKNEKAQAWGHFLRGYGLANSNAAAALKDLDQAIALRPDYARAYVARGWLLYNTGQKERSVADMNEAYRLAPNSVEVLEARATAFVEMQRVEEALTDLDRALEIDPGNPRLYDQQGEAFLAANETKKALSAAEKILAINPDDYRGHLLRGRAFANSGDIKNAEREFATTLELDPQNRFAHVFRGVMRCGAKDYIRGRADLTAIIDVHPDARLILAACAMKNDDPDAALNDIEGALLETPDNTLGLKLRGQIRMEADQFDSALADFDRIIAVGGGGDWNAHWWRAVALMKLGRTSEARAALERADRLSPGNEKVRAAFETLAP